MPAFSRQPDITISSVEMTDWQMLVEKWDGSHNFPRISHDDGKPPPEGGDVVVRQGTRDDDEPVDARIQPESDLAKHGIDDFLIVPVEIRLPPQIMMQIILLAPRIPLPRRATEDREPIVRRRPVGVGVGPDIPIRLRIGPVLAALLKPAVLVRSMPQDHVNNQLQAPFMGCQKQIIEICVRAKNRIH